MPPTLDLNGISHSKMMISPPRMNLRRAASYNYDRGPFHTTSSRFSFNHLVFSPPPSPGLPSLSPPPRRPSRGLGSLVRPSRIIRSTALSGRCLVHPLCLEICHQLLVAAAAPWTRTILSWSAGLHGQFEMVSHEDLPDFPTPIVVTDKRGKPRWSVFVPSTAEFPLAMAEYVDICAKCQEVAARFVRSGRTAHGRQQSYLGFGPDPGDDDYFIDVQEAQEAGYLPSSAKGKNGKAGPAVVHGMARLRAKPAGIGRRESLSARGA